MDRRLHLTIALPYLVQLRLIADTYISVTTITNADGSLVTSSETRQITEAAGNSSGGGSSESLAVGKKCILQLTLC
jgi:hypothetical protein